MSLYQVYMIYLLLFYCLFISFSIQLIFYLNHANANKYYLVRGPTKPLFKNIYKKYIRQNKNLKKKFAETQPTYYFKCHLFDIKASILINSLILHLTNWFLFSTRLVGLRAQLFFSLILKKFANKIKPIEKVFYIID